jgi:mRNA interferase RelE/StbE
MPWTVEVAPRELTHLLSLPSPLRDRIRKQIDLLEQDPYRTAAGKKLKGAPDRFRVRVGDYRIVYRVDADARLVRVERIRHRKDAYRRL